VFAPDAETIGGNFAHLKGEIIMTDLTKKKGFATRDLATIAILAAAASILFLWEIPLLAAVPFYKLDFSNLPVLLATFAMGPVAGTLTLMVKSLVGLLHSSSQGVGELADFLIGMAMVLPAGLIYRRNRRLRTAIFGMAVGGVCATVVGVLSNVYILIPFYSAVYGLQVETIVAMGRNVFPSIRTLWEFVLLITAPFNLVKWTAISIVGGLIYKPLSPILHGRRRAAPVAGADVSAKANGEA
jgi:riboflavin transporter FmnP